MYTVIDPKRNPHALLLEHGSASTYWSNRAIERQPLNNWLLMETVTDDGALPWRCDNTHEKQHCGDWMWCIASYHMHACQFMLLQVIIKQNGHD